MNHRNLVYLTVFFAGMLVLLSWMLGVRPNNIVQKITELKTTLRTDEEVLLYVTLVYALCLSLPFVPGGLGLCILIFTGPKGAPFFMAGTLLSLGLNFLIGRRFPVVMKPFKKSLGKRLDRKAWWPSGEDVSIFLILEHYLNQHRVGKRIRNLLLRLPFPVPLSEKTFIFILMVTPINLVMGGGGGAALVCGEESQLSLWEFLEVVFWAHLLYLILPVGLSFVIP